MVNGIFIVIDGIDGSGKGEMVKFLHNYLFSKSKSYRILTTREPTNGTYGVKIREMLKEEKDPDENAEEIFELFVKDREDHTNNTINPFLKKPNNGEINIVICDRYYYSTIAFQATQGLGVDRLIEANNDFPKPDIAFILDLDPKIALERMQHRAREKFEKQDFMEKLRERFLELPKLLDDNIIIIDASKSKERVFESIREEVENLL